VLCDNQDYYHEKYYHYCDNKICHYRDKVMELVIYCQDTALVDKILYLATKAGVHIIVMYLLGNR